jgi:hypothetical protein
LQKELRQRALRKIQEAVRRRRAKKDQLLKELALSYVLPPLIDLRLCTAGRGRAELLGTIRRPFCMSEAFVCNVCFRSHGRRRSRSATSFCATACCAKSSVSRSAAFPQPLLGLVLEKSLPFACGCWKRPLPSRRVPYTSRSLGLSSLRAWNCCQLLLLLSEVLQTGVVARSVYSGVSSRY